MSEEIGDIPEEISYEEHCRIADQHLHAAELEWDQFGENRFEEKVTPKFLYTLGDMFLCILSEQCARIIWRLDEVVKRLGD